MFLKTKQNCAKQSIFIISLAPFLISQQMAQHFSQNKQIYKTFGGFFPSSSHIYRLYQITKGETCTLLKFSYKKGRGCKKAADIADPLDSCKHWDTSNTTVQLALPLIQWETSHHQSESCFPPQNRAPSTKLQNS